MYKQISTVALFAAGVSAHGHLSSPTPRPLGSAMEAACGQQVYDQMESDLNGNIQSMAQVGATQSDFDATACHLWQCRGYQFADATSSTIQSYTAGQTIDFTAVIAAPHTGVANVSVIDLAANSVIATMDSWSTYASTATGVTANETSFSGVLPSDLPSTCATAGGCAIQWWWDARSIDQTYMTCVDFVVADASGSSSSSDSSSSAVAASSSVAATSSVAAATSSVATTSATTLATSTTAAAATSAAATTSTSAAATSSAAASSDNASTGSTSTCAKKRKARRSNRAARN